MIKNTLGLNWIVLIIGLSLSGKDLLLKIPLEEYKNGFIEINYVSNEGFFQQCRNFFQGDMSIITSAGKWVLKKGLKIIGMPTTITYCIILYFIYKVYKIIQNIQTLCVTSTNADNHLLVNDINKLLYKKINRSKKNKIITARDIALEKRRLQSFLTLYQHLSAQLEILGIRNYFWYNAGYEATLKNILFALQS